MNEQEIGALIWLYGIAAIFCIAVMWYGQHEDAKHRERMRRENLRRAYAATFGKEAADRVMKHREGK